MEKRWFHSMLFNEELKHSGSEDPVIYDRDNNIDSGDDSDNSSANNMDTFLDIDNDRSFMNELESSFYSYLNNGSQSDNHYYDRDSYNYSDSYMYSYICNESVNSSDNESSNIRISTNRSDFNMRRRYNDLDINKKYIHLWVQCESCYGLNYKIFFKSKLNVCEQCRYYLKMSNSYKIELSIDPGTWDPMNEDMVSMDPIEFHLEEEPYKDHQTGLNFQFMVGNMGSIVGEKITRLIEHATRKALPLIIVCASGGECMQEGSLSLMQMAKIYSASYNYQSNKKLFYVSILTSPTTCGVTASFYFAKKDHSTLS
ncbi:hypothetical protein MKX03_003255 [Papaver bracteatum]|nr:hypothetical protein MKX03_003255 [Papaver bracteatum]